MILAAGVSASNQGFLFELVQGQQWQQMWNPQTLYIPSKIQASCPGSLPGT